MTMTQKIPAKISSYIVNIPNEGISQKESKALEQLLLKYEAKAIERALTSVLSNGLPPYGKICEHPLSEFLENPKTLELFSEKVKENKDSLTPNHSPDLANQI